MEAILVFSLIAVAPIVLLGGISTLGVILIMPFALWSIYVPRWIKVGMGWMLYLLLAILLFAWGEM